MEPKWVDLLKKVTPGNLESSKPELKKAMVITDKVRQAQKKGRTIIFFPDGRYFSLDGRGGKKCQ